MVCCVDAYRKSSLFYGRLMQKAAWICRHVVKAVLKAAEADRQEGCEKLLEHFASATLLQVRAHARMRGKRERAVA